MKKKKLGEIDSENRGGTHSIFGRGMRSADSIFPSFNPLLYLINILTIIIPTKLNNIKYHLGA